jgi:plasmid stabilization system protein ParE
MAFQIIWSRTAVEDLREIVQYVALDDPAAAAHLAGRIISRIERASGCLLEPVVPEKADSVRAS